MYKGHKAKEYSINELSVGMEVAFAERSYYVHRYIQWTVCKIKRLTPKKTKVTLDDGRTFKANEYLKMTCLRCTGILLHLETALRSTRRRGKTDHGADRKRR